MKEECVCMCGISCVCVNECVRDMHFFHGHTTCTQSLFLQQPLHFLHLKYMKEQFDKDWRVKEGLHYSSTAMDGESSWMWGKEGRDAQYSTTHSHLSSQLPSNALLLSNLESIGMLCSGYISTSMEIYHYLVLEVKKMNFFKIGLPPVGPAGRSGRGWAGWAREGYQMGIYTPSPMSCPLPKSQ